MPPADGQWDNGALCAGKVYFCAASSADLNVNTQTGITAASNRWDHSPPTTSITSASGGVDIYASALSNVDYSSYSAPPASSCGCSSAAADHQIYNGTMVGCAGTMTRGVAAATLCAPSCHVCTGAEYNANSGSKAPNYHYWASDVLYYYGPAQGSCSVSSTNTGAGGTCSGQSMLVVAGVLPAVNGNVDDLGNRANWSHCGYGTNGLGQANGGTDKFLGGCPTANTNAALGITAGALCCCP